MAERNTDTPRPRQYAECHLVGTVLGRPIISYALGKAISRSTVQVHETEFTILAHGDVSAQLAAAHPGDIVEIKGSLRMHARPMHSGKTVILSTIEADSIAVLCQTTQHN